MTSINDWLGRNVPDAVMDDAAAWLARLDSEQSTLADRAAFARWLNEDATHQWAFEELSEVWARLHTLADVRPLLDDPGVRLFPQPERAAQADVPPAPAARAGSDWTALAASLIVMLGVALHTLGRTPAETHATPAGAAAEIALEDGSRVSLNARSRIDVRIDAEERHIDLQSGEALFEVRQEARPFVVEAGDARVTALGTTFAVQKRPALVEVSVLSGVVSVESGRRDSMLTEYDARDVSLAGRDALLLQAGERLVLSQDRREQRRLGNDELQRELSWRDGYVVFEEQSLVTVIDEMRRYLNTNLHVGDAQLASLRVSGQFRTGDVDGFLEQLHRDYGVIVDHQDANWVVLRTP